MCVGHSPAAASPINGFGTPKQESGQAQVRGQYLGWPILCPTNLGSSAASKSCLVCRSPARADCGLGVWWPVWNQRRFITDVVSPPSVSERDVWRLQEGAGGYRRGQLMTLAATPGPGRLWQCGCRQSGSSGRWWWGFGSRLAWLCRGTSFSLPAVKG